MNDKLKAWMMPIAAGVIIWVLMAISKGLFVSDTAKDCIRHVSDCFAVPGILLSCIAAMSWAGSQGAFDMLGYGTKSFLGLFSKSIRAELPKSYYDYKKQADNKGRKWLVKLLIVGVGFIMISIVFDIVYFML